ncbi:MAG: HU family DNA-binding protein [Muribaculaceae bacterium]|nr:HU family DNA-binding protein [Muribaculaceae bacterium]
MDTKTLVQNISARLDIDSGEVRNLLTAFVSAVSKAATDGDHVAIPSFGTFAAVKNDEEVVTDHVSGKRMLLPPQISLVFTPAAMLRKKLFKDESAN